MLAKNSFVGESSQKRDRIARFWGDDVINFQQIASFSKLIALKGRVAIFAVLLALGVGGNAWGQVITKYTFSNNTSSSLTDLSSGATALLSGIQDDAATAVTTIGFDFFYGGVRYSHFSANSNGQFQLHTTSGATAIGSANISSYTASTPILFPMSGDNEVSGGINYKVIGSAPNRTLVIEWTNFYAFYTDLTNAGNMQAWLEESTGKISYVYGEIYNSSSATVARGVALSFGNTATTAGYVTVGASPTFTASATLTTNTFAIGSGTTTGSPLIANLGTSSASARRAYVFTPPSSMASPTSLTFASVTTTGMTLNWTAASPTTNIVKYAIYNSTDNVNFTYVSTVALGTNTYAATGLNGGTTYYWKVYPLSEGALGTALTGSQATTAYATYYWTGTATAEFTTAATWNTAANGSGSARSSALTTDILIIDGAGTTAGTAITGGTISASATVGQLKITSSTAVTLASTATTQRVITISGGSTGDDFVIGSGSTLNLTNTANTISIIFSGTGTTGDISGTLNIDGTSATATSANSFLTTGGTGTIVTVSSTGIINNTATTNIGTNGNVTGSAATLVFANGSNYNVSGATTGAPWVPLATWGATSTLSISGLTSSTTPPTNNVQSFGNFIYNCSGGTAVTMSFWTTSTTAVIKGNLTITTTGLSTFRALTSGTLTVNGNLNVNGGTFQTFSNAATFNVLGNINLAAGTLDVASGAGTTNLKGNFTQTGGTLTQTANTGKLSFNGTVAQTFTPTTHTSTALVVEINNSLGATLSGALNLFKLTLTSGNITTGSNVITIINTATTGISGGSASSFVYGKLARTLPLSLASGSTYTFPVGKGSYNPFELVNPTTTSSASLAVVQAEVFDASSGGSAGTNMCSIYTSRYWAASITANSASFTNTFIKLTDAANVVSTSAIASSGTLAGTYNIVGSTTPTIVASTSVQSASTAATTIPGFYAIGTVGGTPTITAGTLTSFGTSNCINLTAGPNSFTVTGSALTGDLTVGALTGFTYCGTSGGTYASTLTLTAGTCGAISTTVYVKFTPTAVLSYNGNIAVSGGGATSVNVAAVGSGVNTAAIATTGISSSIAATTVTLAGSYTANCQTISAYGIEYSTTSGFTSGTGTQSASTNQSAGSFTSSITGLTANTTYYYKAYATYGATTVWGTQSSFTTLCTVSSLPYTQGFNVGATTSSSAACWSQNNVSGSISVYQVTSTPAAGFNTPTPANYAGTGMVGYPSYNNTASTRLVTPALVTTGVSSVDVEFQWFHGSDGGAYAYVTEGMTVQYSTNGSTWTTVGSKILRYSATAGWTLKSITLPAGAANVATLYVGFLFDGLAGYDMYLDNVDIHATPNCSSQPTALTSSAISSTTATISWTAASTAPASGYEYYYSTSSTAPTAGTTATGTVAAGVVTNALTGLTASTPYYFWVRSKCNGTDKSNWAGSGTFTTLCAAANVPYTMDFSTATVPAFATCTSAENVGSGNIWTTIAGNSTYGFNSNALQYSYSSSFAANTWFYTQGLNLTGGTTYTLTYRYGASTFTENLKVAYGTSPSSASMTTALSTHASFTNSTPTNVSLDFTPSSTGVYYFGFNCYSTANQYLVFVDDIVISGKTNYYLKANQDPSATASWGTNTDGTGTAPSAMNTTFANWNITQNSNTPTTAWANSWTLGSGSTIIVKASSTLNIAGTLDMVAQQITAGASATVNVTSIGKVKTSNTDGFSGSTSTTISSTNTPTVSLDNASTVEYYGSSAQTVTNGVSYGNLTYSGTSTATIAGNTTINGNLSLSGTAGEFRWNNTGSTSYTVTVLGNLTMTNGSKMNLNASGTTGINYLNLSGNLNISGASTYINTSYNPIGAIVFKGTSPTYTNTATATNDVWTNFTVGDGTNATTLTLNSNLKLNGSNSANAAALTINNSGILDAGTYNFLTSYSVFNAANSNSAFIINSGGTLKTANTGGISGTATSTSTGTISTTRMTTTFNAGANYVFNGATTTPFPTTFSNPANVTINQAVTLNTPVTMSGVLTLGAILTPSTNLLTLTNTANTAISGASSTAFINGPVTWTLGSASTGSYIVPVGVTAAYYPLAFTAGSNTGSPTITVTPYATGVGSADASTIYATSGNEYWSVVTTAGFVATNFSLGRSTPALGNLKVIGKNTTNSSYVSIGGSTSGSTTLSSQPSVNTSSSGISGAATNYLTLAQKLVSVTYDANTSTGGTVPSTTNYGYNTTATVATNSGSLVKTGYTFSGWNTAADGTGTAYAATGSVTYTITASTTLYAQWRGTVTYDLNTGSGTTPTDASTYLPSATVTTAASTGLTKTGYTFVGWNTAADGTGTTTVATNTFTFTGTVTLYAKWTANSNTITFNGNGNDGGSMSTQTLATAATANLTANAFTLTGYNFTGWATSSGGAATYSDAASYTMGTGNVTLFAVWVSAAGPSCPSLVTVAPTSSQSKCVGDAGTALTASVTSTVGLGTPTLQYKWYYNTTNTNTISGSTVAITTGGTSVSYTPLTTVAEVGTRYYFCVAYATDNSCTTTATTGPASTPVEVIINAIPSVPTGTASQTFCSALNSTVANLSASAGSTVLWYTASSGGTLKSSSDALTTATHYYAGQTVNGCPSASRLDVTVTINTTPSAPTGSAAQSFCSGNSPTVAELAATGSSILWYAAASAGSSLATTLPLTTATPYYASQTVSGCESSSRLMVTATINTTQAVPATPTATTNPLCTGSATSLSTTTTGNDVTWYTQSSGGTSVGTSASGAAFSVSPIANTTYYAETSVNTSTVVPITTSTPTWTVPAGVTSIDVQVWGAGGGGGGGKNAGAASGGGSGGYISYTSLPVTAGETFNISIGAAGTGAAGGGTANTVTSSASTGGTSSFVRNSSSITLFSAAGGTGGAQSSASSVVGAGGIATIHSSLSGGTAITGNSGVAGKGGDAPGSGGAGGAAVAVNSLGNSGASPGGAGGGAYKSSSNLAGGSGGAGKVIITYTTSTASCASASRSAGLTVNVNPVPLTSSLSATAASSCGTSTATVTVTSSTLLAGAYTVTYNVSGTNTVASTTATMSVASDGAGGTFTTSTLATFGSANVVTITAIAYTGACSKTVSVSTATFTSGNSTTWIGATSTDWNTANNWSCGVVPTSSIDVIIATAANQPIISAAAVCNSITLNSGTTLAVNSTLGVSGNWTNNSSASAVSGSTSGVVTLSGTCALSGTYATSFPNLTITGTVTNGITGTTVTGTYSQTGGTFTANSPGTSLYNLNFNIFSLTGGTFENQLLAGTATGTATNINITGSFTQAATSTYTCSGAGFGKIIFKGGGNVTYSNVYTTAVANFSYIDMQVSENTTLTLNTNLNIYGHAGAGTYFTVDLGSTLNCGVFQLSNLGATIVYTYAINGTLKTANTFGLNGLTTTTLNSSTNFPVFSLGASSTIEYNSAVAAQAVTGRSDYANLTINNTYATNPTCTLGAVATVAKNLSVVSGIFNASTFAITGNATNTFTLASGTTFRTAATTTTAFPTLFTTANCSFDVASTVEYYGATQTVSGTPVYGNLIISASGTKTAGTAVTVAGNLTVNTSATLAGAANAITLSGNFSNAGTFSQTTSTTLFTFNKNGDQTVSGAGSFGFMNIVLDKTALANKVTCSSTVSAGSNGITYTAGTWEQSAGTLSFSSGNQTISSAIGGKLMTSGTGSITFPNSAIVPALGTLVMNSSGTMTVGSSTGNALQITGGTVQLTAGTVNVAARIGGASNLTGTGTLTIDGATINVNTTGLLSNTSNGVFSIGTGTTFAMSSGTLNIMQANQGANTTINDLEIKTGTISGGSIVLGSASPGTQEFLVNVEVDANNITVNSGSNAATLVSDATVLGTLTLTSGKLIVSGTKTLSIGNTTSNGTISGGSITSYIVAYKDLSTASTGTLKRFVNTAASTAYNLPIGDASKYTPMTFTLASATSLSNASISVFTKAEKVAGINSLVTNYLNRYWDLTPSGITGANYSVDYTYATTDIQVPLSEALLLPVKRSLTSTGPDVYTWYKPTGSSFTGGLAASITGTSAINTTTHTLSWSGLSTFSQFTAAGDQIVNLPIDLLSFDAKKQNQNNLLFWSTATETNCDYFTIEKTIDGESYEVVGNVNGGGTSFDVLNYTLVDYDVRKAINYYRLKQTDTDGAEKISALVSVDNRDNLGKEVAMKTNLLGQEINENYRGVVIIVFTDGTSMKIIQ